MNIEQAFDYLVQASPRVVRYELDRREVELIKARADVEKLKGTLTLIASGEFAGTAESLAAYALATHGEAAKQQETSE